MDTGNFSVEQVACWQLLNDVAASIRERFNPDGFSIGINIGRAAGQTSPEYIEWHNNYIYNG